MDGVTARRQLFATINAFNDGDIVEGYRLWADVFKLYSNKEWNDHRISAEDMTTDEIQAVRQFMSTTDWLVASTIEAIWRVILSGLVYFRIDVLPEFFKVLDPPRIESDILQQIVHFEKCIYFSSTEREEANFIISPELANDCDHFWWTVSGSEQLEEHEVDIREEYYMTD